VAKVDAWRRRQPDNPNVSESIRRLVELGLATKTGGKRALIRTPSRTQARPPSAQRL
jgi:hypothetical protein